jgi:HupE / UreJ protein
LIRAHDIRSLQRTRLRPGPLVLFTLAWLVLSPASARAHDPGLSTLDVGVSRGAISVSLSLAAADLLPIAAATPDVDPRNALSALAREAIHLSVDGARLSSSDDEVSVDDTGGRARMFFVVPATGASHSALTIESGIPSLLARGHRQLLVVSMSGAVQSQLLLDAESDSLTIDLGARSATAPGIAWSFLKLGNHHILSGYDHLLFLAGLFLAAASVRELVMLLSAFTVAHSISLALVVIGGVHLPASIVEPLIAVSIAWVGVENLVRERHGGRWLVVFAFGLIHGFGFAGALLDLGFGSSVADVAIALVSFNAGVESGQLVVAAFVLPLIWTIRSRPVWQAKLQPLCSVLIAIAGGCWLVARLL